MRGGCRAGLVTSSKAGHGVLFLTTIALRMNNALPIECMKPDYKAVLHAVQKRDKALWDLGDALVAECGAPDPTSAGYAGPGRLRAAWHCLQANGCDVQPCGVIETSPCGVCLRTVDSTVRYFVGTVRRGWYAGDVRGDHRRHAEGDATH